MSVAVDQLRAKSPDELRLELTGLRREHFNLRVQKAVQQLNKPSELRRVRRDIARALTVLREKEMSEFAQTGRALEFTRASVVAKPAPSAEAEVSPEIAAAAAAAAALPAPAAAAVAPAPVADEKPESKDAAEPKAEVKPESVEPTESAGVDEKPAEADGESKAGGSGSEKQERAS